MGKQRAEAQATKISVLNCIDLSNPDTNHNINLIKQACTDSASFYIVNHGISQDFMHEVFAQSKKFFTLPIDQKMKLLKNEKHRGYTPLLDEVLDPQNQVNGDYKEEYYVGVEVDEDDPKSQKPFCGPNIWPASDILPGWRETVERFQRVALQVGKAVAKLIALALDLDANFFEKPEILGEPIGMMRMLCYEARISDPSQGLYGAGAHTDYGLLTLLATDDVPGLQICKERDAKPQIWEDVAPRKGIYSESWQHAGALEQLYFQIAYFVEPGHDCPVECLPTCKSDSNPSKFPPIYYGDYLSQRCKDTHADLHIHKKQES